MSAEFDDLLEMAGGAFQTERPACIGVAVSGGSDSMALLCLLSQLCERHKAHRLSVVTVDHGLRPDAAAEATHVAETCAGLGHQHTVLHWRGWDRSGNLQDRARQARYSLIADWATASGISTVALGHTADDQAENFLIRLARESGVDGLSGMSSRRKIKDVMFLRPMLTATRSELRDFLRDRGIRWVDDPSNDDPRFARVRARKLIADLGPLGITARTLAAVSLNLRAARRALDSSTQSILRNFARVEQGNVVFDLGEIMRQPPEITRRLLSHVLKWVSSADFAPRRQALENLAQSLREGRKTVLHGCMITVERDEIRVIREYQAVRGLCAEPGEIWDQRWILYGPVYKGLEVRALGEGGLLNCPKWRESGQPRDAIMASPGVWSGAELVAAPHAGLSNSWRAELCKGEDDFFTSVLSH